MNYEFAQEKDIEELFALQLRAFESEAEMIGSRNVPALMESFEENRADFRNWTVLVKRNKETRYMDNKKKAKWIFAAIAVLAVIIGLAVWVNSSKKTTAITYEEFKALSPEKQIETFDNMSGEEIYALVESSDENWPVTAYDLITPENAKETIVLYDNNGDLHFNLAWPCYGGFVPESIASMGDLSGKLDVSRDGGDGGYSMSYGKNDDGSYPNDSQRSVPKSSATVRTGTLDADQYKKVVDVVTSGEGKEERKAALEEMGYDAATAESFIEDQNAWLSRDEVSGPDNIQDGAKAAGHTVDSRYGYCGITAPWDAGDLILGGGGGQLETVFSWGTLCASGLISDTGTAEIN